MKPILDHTHDIKIKSWLDSANLPGTDFSLQNLPFGIFRRRNSRETPRVGVAIGDSVLDVSACAVPGLFPSELEQAAKSCSSPTLNALMALGRPHWTGLRHQLHSLLRSDASKKIRSSVSAFLVPRAEAELLLPAGIGDYTDFYASIFHATNVGAMFRPDNPLLPNYKYVPIGYHGRASSIVPSGTAIHRPAGQIRPDANAPPQFTASRQLDYELEVGFFVGSENPQAQAIDIAEAGSRIFGLCLLNDWSARDIQSWEYQPLGPFLSKSLAPTSSPLIGTLDALAPFRTGAFPRPESDPKPLPYLFSVDDQQYGGLDAPLEVFLRTTWMRCHHFAPALLLDPNPIQSRCPIFFRSTISSTAAWMPRWKFFFAPPGCAPKTGKPFASAAATFATCIGPSRKCSRITPAMVATCAPATCWLAEQFLAIRKNLAAVCSN